MLTVDFRDFNNRNIKCTATKIEYSNRCIAKFLVHSISQSCGGRLVNNALDVETCDLACVFCCLALRVIKVSRNSNDCSGHFRTKVILCGFFHFHQHARRYFRRRHRLAVSLNPCVTVFGFCNIVRHHVDVTLYDIIFKSTTNQTLDRKKCVRRICDRLALSRLTDQNLIIFSKSNDRRCRSIAFTIFNNLGGIALHNCNAGVRGTKVDTNNFTHVNTLQKK